MFTYNDRLYARYGRAVASFAALANDRPGWRPRGFALTQLGCTHRFRFPIYADRLAALEADPNPFAMITAALRYTASTRQDPPARDGFKRRLVGLLYRQGSEQQRGLDLVALLDWLMRLSPELEAR